MTWIDTTGWDSAGPIDTFWMGDPAINQDASDLEAYNDSLDPGTLVVKDGETPVRMLVLLPTAKQYDQMRGELRLMADRDDDKTAALTDPAFTAACIVAVECCVRFPDEPTAQPKHRFGCKRLPVNTIKLLHLKFPELIAMIGVWIMSRYVMDANEKKASSSASGQKTSVKKGRTTAKRAARKGKGSKAVRTKAKPRKRRTA